MRVALRRLTVAAMLVAAAACVGKPTGISVQLADRDVEVWEPPTQAPAPVVIFSHGFHGCSIQSQFLTQALAAAGYFVFAPNHRDATCNHGPAHWFEGPEVAFQLPEKWSDATFRDRRDDITAIIAALHTDARFRDRLDFDELGLVGHSLGGYTVLGLGGAWPSWKLPGVKGIIAMSPFASPFVTHGTLPGIDVPLMYQGGTSDSFVTPTVARPGGAYDLTPPPKYFVDLTDAGHFAWTDLRDTDHAAIVAYAIAFLNVYVRGEADPHLTERRAEVADLRVDAPSTTSPQAASAARQQNAAAQTLVAAPAQHAAP